MAIATKSFIQVHQINFGNGVEMHYSIGSFPFSYTLKINVFAHYNII